MPELSNTRHEEFALLVAGGMAKIDAYQQANPKVTRDAARSRGSLLAMRPEVAERIRELLEEDAGEAVWTLAERLKYLRDVALTSHADLSETSPLCRGIKRTALGVEYRMPDKLAAVALYGKLAGDLEPQAETTRDVMRDMIGAIRSGRTPPPKWGRVLRNARNEQFAQLVGSGERVAYAYEKVYGARPSSAIVAGRRLAQEPAVAERIREIRQAGAAEVGWTRSMRMSYLRKLAEIPIGQVDERSCYCQGVRRSRHGDEIKVPNKVHAVALYSALAQRQQTRLGRTIEEIVTEIRAGGREELADGTESSLIRFVWDTIG